MDQTEFNYESGIRTMPELDAVFRMHGVSTLYIKHLAEKQDNEKNQIVLASAGAKNILTMFPAKLAYRSPSASKKKRNSKAGQKKVEMKLNFFWLDRKGAAHHAPETKIINYFQFPEARMSGFIKGCRRHAPDALRRKHQHIYGRRVLVLGANDERDMFGIVLTEKEDTLVSDFPALECSSSVPLLLEYEAGVPSGMSARDHLLQELGDLSGKWHSSQILKPGQKKPAPFKGNQGAGYTLEALLGVPANADKAPDKYGFEIKSFKKSGKISLMTPTADLGYEGENSFREFMSRYGWDGAKGDGRRVFNGTFRYRVENERRPGLAFMLDVAGYRPKTCSFSDNGDEIYVSLKSSANNELVSGWSLDKLLTGWNNKHNNACYVEYEKRAYQGSGNAHDAEYRYTGRVLVCEGTSVWEYLTSIIGKIVYYDPAHEIKSNDTHVRPQWRISVTKKIQETLASLYDTVTDTHVKPESSGK